MSVYKLKAPSISNASLKGYLLDSSSVTTSNVSEGINLYYTNSRVRSAISVSGSGTYDSSTGVISITGDVVSADLTTANVIELDNLYFTNARSIGAFIPGDGITIESNGLISAASVGGSNTQIQFNDDGALEGNVNLTFNKANSTLTTATLIATNPIIYNGKNITSNVNIVSSFNGFSAGPITIDDGFEVVVEDGANWSIL